MKFSETSNEDSRFNEKWLTSPKMGTVPPQSSSCSSSSQMAASKGKLVQQPPALVAIILTHSRMASTRFSLRVADLGHIQRARGSGSAV